MSAKPTSRGLGFSFQSAITVRRLSLIRHSNAPSARTVLLPFHRLRVRGLRLFIMGTLLFGLPSFLLWYELVSNAPIAGCILPLRVSNHRELYSVLSLSLPHVIDSVFYFTPSSKR